MKKEEQIKKFLEMQEKFYQQILSGDFDGDFKDGLEVEALRTYKVTCDDFKLQYDYRVMNMATNKVWSLIIKIEDKYIDEKFGRFFSAIGDKILRSRMKAVVRGLTDARIYIDVKTFLDICKEAKDVDTLMKKYKSFGADVPNIDLNDVLVYDDDFEFDDDDDEFED